MSLIALGRLDLLHLAIGTLVRVAAATRWPHAATMPAMAQGKRISADIGADALQAIKDMGAAAKRARTRAGDGQASAAARLGVHVQTIARIESGEPGVAVGHVLGLLALYGIHVTLPPPLVDSVSVPMPGRQQETP